MLRSIANWCLTGSHMQVFIRCAAVSYCTVIVFASIYYGLMP